MSCYAPMVARHKAPRIGRGQNIRIGLIGYFTRDVRRCYGVGKLATAIVSKCRSESTAIGVVGWISECAVNKTFTAKAARIYDAVELAIAVVTVGGRARRVRAVGQSSIRVIDHGKVVTVPIGRTCQAKLSIVPEMARVAIAITGGDHPVLGIKGEHIAETEGVNRFDQVIIIVVNELIG